MFELVLRDEDAPDETVVVVRGGEMQSIALRRAAARARADVGIFAVSVYLVLDTTIQELCRMEPSLARYGKIRLSTVGRLKLGGFPLIPTLNHPHYDVVLPDLHESTLGRLEACFDAPIENPSLRKLRT